MKELGEGFWWWRRQLLQRSTWAMSARAVPQSSATKKRRTSVTLTRITASVAPSRHASAAGTFTKEQLLNAINKDARESSLEELLGPPAYRKENGWSSFAVWTDKLDTGGDSPAMFTAEIAKYNGTPLGSR